MRPVRLDLNGFASFRDPATIDFTDADYFALVGPTGSGKSTVLDAITFALYGSAPRWGRVNAISYALAPTSNRATVSLIFDIGTQRYQVAREVRRVGQNIQQKAVSLVRFTDPNADTDPNAEVLAGEVRELTPAVENLLGLSFDDFCQCVVLPQGEFAQFLSATAGDRQKILLKLLGAGHYEQIGKRAHARAAAAAQEATILTDQLAGHADATEAAEAAARDTEQRLLDLTETVNQLVPQITDTQRRASQAEQTARTLQDEAGLLAAIATPPDVAALQQSASEAAAAVQAATTTAAAAAVALADANAAAKAGPQRGVLELAQDRYVVHADLAGRRAEIETHARTTAAEADSAKNKMDATATTVSTARTDAETAAGRVRELVQDRDRLQVRHRQLTAVTTPPEVGDLAARAADLTDQEQAAARDLEAAQARHEQAGTALAAAPDPGRLDHARGELSQLTQTLTDLAAAEADLRAAKEVAAATEQTLTDKEQEMERAAVALAEAQARTGAAQLRPHLRVGDACPVCEQQVSTLPPPLTDPGLGEATTAHTRAQQAYRDAHTEHQKAAALVAAQQQKVATLTDRRDQADTRLAGLLPDRPAADQRNPAADQTYLDQQAAARQQLADAAIAARSDLDTAQRTHTDTVHALTALERDLARVRSQLHTVLGTVNDQNPPSVDDSDLAAAWATLASWAADQATRVSSELATVDEAVRRATVEEETVDQALRAAELAAQEAQAAYTEAVKDATAAAHAHETLVARLAELDTQLATAPPADQLSQLLAECERLEAAVEKAVADHQQARDALTAAQSEQDRWQSQVNQARTQLQEARDRVGALSPPPVDTDDLAAGWATLTGWAQQETTDRQDRIAKARGDADTAAADGRQLTSELGALLDEHGLDPAELGDAPDRASRAPQLVAVAATRAHAQVEAIVKSRAAAQDLQGKIEQARTTEQVASELAGLLRASKFPQWLAEAALDSLVAGASESLRKLSGDQYDLTHRKGDFYVIDHADADSQRSVRTLSGGETFQASLALALALSEQLAGIGGATKLESIFLDEGFGTLDPDTLETVAGTLETLAQGERMVGVITHVPALADRAPVRFRVHHDTRTSTITRETV